MCWCFFGLYLPPINNPERKLAPNEQQWIDDMQAAVTEDYQDVAKVAAEIGIPYYSVNFATKERMEKNYDS